MKNYIKPLAVGIIGLLSIATVASAHGDEFKPAFVDSLVPNYLATQTALAGDDLGGAKKAAGELVATAKNGPSFPAFTAPASAIAQAENIKSARATFLTVSMEMQDLVDHVGTTGEHSLYEAHCPMAFGGKGGSWLQGDQNVLNPYFGSLMLHCGSIKGIIAGASKTNASPGGDHSGQNH